MLKSIINPGMNLFLSRLDSALKKLPNNQPKSTQGFGVCYIDPSLENKFFVEEIGEIPRQDRYEILFLAMHRANLLLYSKRFRSEDGAIRNFSGTDEIVCIAGYDKMLNEAIAILWLSAKNSLAYVNVFKTQDEYTQHFFGSIKKDALKKVRNYAHGNVMVSRLLEELL
ncbi:MAG: hypothetical protein WCX46_00275 [Candidatus Paceibacterota bacterium]